MVRGFKKNGKFRPTGKGSGLKSFQMKNISENLAELDLELRDIREAISLKQRKGDKATGELKSQQKVVGQARNSILNLVETLPPEEHKKIVDDFIDFKKEFTE